MGMKRHELLMDILIKQKQTLTVSDYAQMLAVSKRTVYSDLEKIRPILLKKGYELEAVPGKGYSVKRMAAKVVEEDLPQDTDYFPESRRKTLLKRLIAEDTPVPIEDFAEEFFVSASSIRNDLDLLNSLAGENNIQLKVEKMTIVIQGNEESIQRYMLAICDSLVNHIEDIYSIYKKEIIDSAISIIRNFEQVRNMEVPARYFNQIIQVMALLATRAGLGKHITANNEELFLDQLMEQPERMLAREIMQNLQQRCNIEFSEADCEYFTGFLIADRIQFPSTETISNEEAEVFSRVLERMEKLLNIDIRQHTEIVENIYKHLHAMVYRLKNGIPLKNELLEQTKKEFGPMYEMTGLVLESECSSLNIKLSPDEIGFVMIYFQSLVDIEKKSKKVLLVCPLGIASSQLMLNRLKYALPPLDILEVASIQKAKSIPLTSIDFIISTTDFKAEKPVLVVSPLIDQMDIQNIQAFYQKIAFPEEKKQEVQFKLLKVLLDEKNIITGNQKTREDVLKKMASHLSKQGLVEKEYGSSLLKREMQGATDNRYKTAIPHGSLDLVKKTCVSIWIGKNPIKWSSHPVKIAIFLNINKQDLPLCKDLVEEIYMLIKSDTLGQLLESSRPKENLIQYINRSINNDL